MQSVQGIMTKFHVTVFHWVLGGGEKSHTGAISAAPVKLFVHKKKKDNIL